MLGLTGTLNYYLFNGSVDMRKGIYGLSDVVRHEMKQNPNNPNNVYIFLSKNRRVIKILHYERGFYVLYEKRPLMGQFIYIAYVKFLLKTLFNRTEICLFAKKKIMNSIIQNQLSTIKELCKQYKVKSLYSFGSVNTPSFTDKSDIDLLIDFDQDISIEDYTDNFFSLREKFSQLFKREIDLVTRRSLSNPFFIQDVEQSKVLIYG